MLDEFIKVLQVRTLSFLNRIVMIVKLTEL